MNFSLDSSNRSHHIPRPNKSSHNDSTQGLPLHRICPKFLAHIPNFHHLLSMFKEIYLCLFLPVTLPVVSTFAPLCLAGFDGIKVVSGDPIVMFE